MSTELKSDNSNKEENNNNESEIMSLIDDLYEKNDIDKIKEINSKCVDLIFEEKTEKSLDILKKLEIFLENKLIDIKSNFNKKILIIILHNIACCYQKLKDNEKCINYLDAVVYHFDKLIEEKHNIKINAEYFDNLIKTPNPKYEKESLGDLILELRFCAKFHLQMGVVLSESKKNVDSLKHIRLAALICEDNLIKTKYLYDQLKDSLLNEEDKNNKDSQNSDMISIKEQIKYNYKIIMELYKRMLNLRNNKKDINNFNESKSKKNVKTIYNNNYIHIKNVITKIAKNSVKNNNENLPFNYYDSYLNFRKNEIDNYIERNITLRDIKTIFENNFNQKDDWIKLLNIENIMYLSALNYEDLDLESEPKYELLRDSILEKVIMLSVAYYCLSKELRYFSKDKYKKAINGEYYLYNAINLTILFLPVSSPIIRHYIMTYYKNFGQGIDIIPEGEVIDYKIDIIRKEIEPNVEDFKDNKIDKFIGQDFLCFSRVQKVKRIIREENNNYFTINNDIKIIKSNSNKKKLSKEYYYKNYNITKKRRYNIFSKINEEKKKSNSLIHSAQLYFNNRDTDIINISDNNILNKKNFILRDFRQKYEPENSKISNSLVSSNISLCSEIKDNNNYINISNGNFGLIPNNNFNERVNKSKISDKKAPKFKLNFHNINSNISNNNTSKNINLTEQIISKTKDKKDKESKKEMNLGKKRHIPKIKITNKFSSKTSINIQFNHNCKTNTNINININNINKKNNNTNYNKHPLKTFNKISIPNLECKTERPHLKGTNNGITQKKIINKKNPKKTKDIKKNINIKKIEKSSYSLYNEKFNNNNISNITKYFNVKTSNILNKENLTDRFIVRINNKLKDKGIKINKNITISSNSPDTQREINNQIYKNYVKKKKKDKNPIKLIQNNTKEETTIVSSILSDMQKSNLSNVNNNSNIRNFYSNDSNIEEFTLGARKIYKLKVDNQKFEKKKTNNKSENDRINKYLKNINLIKKLINNNTNKSNSIDKNHNKEKNINHQNKFYQALKRIKASPEINIKLSSNTLKNQKK